jgi:hypothetical protein
MIQMGLNREWGFKEGIGEEKDGRGRLERL